MEWLSASMYFSLNLSLQGAKDDPPAQPEQSQF